MKAEVVACVEFAAAIIYAGLSMKERGGIFRKAYLMCAVACMVVGFANLIV